MSNQSSDFFLFVFEEHVLQTPVGNYIIPTVIPIPDVCQELMDERNVMSGILPYLSGENIASISTMHRCRDIVECIEPTNSLADRRFINNRIKVSCDISITVL